MPQKYKFDERYASGLEILKNCINNVSCMPKKINVYQKELVYNDKKFRQILGSDYGKIIDGLDSIEKSFTPVIYEIYRYHWIYNYVCDSLKKNKEIKYYSLLKIMNEEQFSFGLDKLKENYVCKMIDIWSNKAEKGGKMKWAQIMPILLVKNKSTSQKNKEYCLKEIKEFVKNKTDLKDNESGITASHIELCFEFLYYKVFPEVDFWKIYYANKEKVFQNWKCNCIIAWLNNEDISANSNMIQKKDELRTIIAGNPNSMDIVWMDSESHFNFFQINFRRYEYVRCFYLLYTDIFRKDELGKAYLSAKISNQYEKYFSWNQRISITIHKIFEEWISPVNYQNIFHSVLKEILIIILKDSRKPKKDCGWLISSEKRGIILCTSKNKYEESLWCTDIQGSDISDQILKTYFDPVYEIRISMSKYKYIRNVMSGQKVRSKSFENLISNLSDLEEDLPFFERYMIESQTGIYSAWELYNIFFEVLSISSKTTGKGRYESLQEQIKKLVRTINRIHNLELKMWFIHQLEGIVSDIMEDASCNIYDAIEIIIGCLEREVLEFQKKYNTMFFALLYLFKNESDWKNMMWMRNFKTEEVISAMEKFRCLENHVDKQSHMRMKVNALYNAETKREPYKWFRDIWKSLITNFN